MILDAIRGRIETRKLQKEWRRRNIHNNTSNNNRFCFDNVLVGNYTYGSLTVLDFGDKHTLKIGSCCSIASGVVFNLSGDHPLNRISTFPFKAKALGGPLNEAASKGDIIIDDDVWIGQNAIILSGVHIGQGAVVAAGAVVSKDVPPYAIAGGIPSKIIKYRFNPLLISYLLTLDYASLTKELIQMHVDDLYMDIDKMKLDEIRRKYDWFPKRSFTIRQDDKP